ncbi:hypothetical protein D3C72_677040 [compost metagenome]
MALVDRQTHGLAGRVDPKQLGDLAFPIAADFQRRTVQCAGGVYVASLHRLGAVRQAFKGELLLAVRKPHSVTLARAVLEQIEIQRLAEVAAFFVFFKAHGLSSSETNVGVIRATVSVTQEMVSWSDAKRHRGIQQMRKIWSTRSG